MWNRWGRGDRGTDADSCSLAQGGAHWLFAGAKIGLVTGWVVDESHAVMQFLDLQPGDSVPDAKTI